MSTCTDLKPTTDTTRICRECGEEFELPPFRIAAKYVKVCPECSERHAEEDQRRMVMEAGCLREERWKQLCPVLFQDTEAHKLPSPTKLQKVLAWQYGRRGLNLHGVSGQGKSRCAWLLIKREFLAGRSVAVMDCGSGFEYAAKFSVSASDAARWVQAKAHSEILLMDDLFKVKLTDSLEQAVFSIINHRTERGLPTITTTQDTGETLLSRMSVDRGAALIRRLREFGDSIPF